MSDFCFAAWNPLSVSQRQLVLSDLNRGFWKKNIFASFRWYCFILQFTFQSFCNNFLKFLEQAVRVSFRSLTLKKKSKKKYQKLIKKRKKNWTKSKKKSKKNRKKTEKKLQKNIKKQKHKQESKKKPKKGRETREKPTKIREKNTQNWWSLEPSVGCLKSNTKLAYNCHCDSF